MVQSAHLVCINSLVGDLCFETGGLVVRDKGWGLSGLWTTGMKCKKHSPPSLLDDEFTDDGQDHNMGHGMSRVHVGLKCCQALGLEKEMIK